MSIRLMIQIPDENDVAHCNFRHLKDRSQLETDNHSLSPGSGKYAYVVNFFQRTKTGNIK